MVPVIEARRSPSRNTFAQTPPLALDSGFGALEGDALGLVERRYGDRGLMVSRERYSSRSQDGDIVCTARDGDAIVGTLSVAPAACMPTCCSAPNWTSGGPTA
jgi:hypothetical protein